MSSCCQSNKTWKPSTWWHWSRYSYSFAERYLKIEFENTFFLWGQCLLDKANIFYRFKININIQELFLVIAILLNKLKHSLIFLPFCSDSLSYLIIFILFWSTEKLSIAVKKGRSNLTHRMTLGKRNNAIWVL